MTTPERYLELKWKFELGIATFQEMKEYTDILDHCKTKVMKEIHEAEATFDNSRSKMKRLFWRPFWITRLVIHIYWKFKDWNAKRKGKTLIPNKGPCAVCGQPVRHYYPDWTMNPDKPGAMPLHEDCSPVWYRW